MKHVQIVTRYQMPWLEPMAGYFQKNGMRVTACDIPHPEVKPDTYLFMWADDTAKEFISCCEKNARYVLCIRSYDLYFMPWEEIDLSRVEALICVNDYMAKAVEEETGRLPAVIYNTVDVDKWTFKERGPGHKIAMVGHIHYKKNHALALQILSKLPKEYSLHCAGEIQCPDVVHYISNLAEQMQREVIFYGHVDDVDGWLEDKNFILSTSFREGCPNNVLEAMAKGIRPVVHNWPGAVQQFSPIDYGRHKLVFHTVDQASELIESPFYHSREYRSIVEGTFGSQNFQKYMELL